MASGKESNNNAREEMRRTLQWAARLLYYMGFDYEDIVSFLAPLGSLAELAELEGPRAVEMLGR